MPRGLRAKFILVSAVLCAYAPLVCHDLVVDYESHGSLSKEKKIDAGNTPPQGRNGVLRAKLTSHQDRYAGSKYILNIIEGYVILSVFCLHGC